VLPFIWQAGGDVPSLGDAGSVQALTYVNTLMNVDKSAPRAMLQWGHSDVEDQFDSRLCAMMINGPWVLPSVKKAGFGYGVAPLPPGAKGSASPLGGEVWVVGRSSKHVAQAWDAISHLADPKVGVKELGSGLGAIPNRQDTVADPAWRWDPVVTVFAQEMPYARARSVYGGAKWSQVAEAIWTMTQQVLTGQKSPQAAAGEAKAKVQPLLGG
jgi:multiple sugar transport system substrate-binding protein